jgi:hypothetical protein
MFDALSPRLRPWLPPALASALDHTFGPAFCGWSLESFDPRSRDSEPQDAGRPNVEERLDNGCQVIRGYQCVKLTRAAIRNKKMIDGWLIKQSRIGLNYQKNLKFYTNTPEYQ